MCTPGQSWSSVVLPTTNPVCSGLQSHPLRWSENFSELCEISSQETTFLLWLHLSLLSPSMRLLGKFSFLWGPLLQRSVSQIEGDKRLLKNTSISARPGEGDL